MTAARYLGMYDLQSFNLQSFNLAMTAAQNVGLLRKTLDCPLLHAFLPAQLASCVPLLAVRFAEGL